MELTSLQQSLREQLVARLKSAGIEPQIKQKIQRLPGDDDDEDEHQRALVMSFDVGDKAYEVWLYPDEAGVMEPGDDWWPFDLEGFEDHQQLATALVEHVEDILEEAAEE